MFKNKKRLRSVDSNFNIRLLLVNVLSRETNIIRKKQIDCFCENELNLILQLLFNHILFL